MISYKQTEDLCRKMNLTIKAAGGSYSAVSNLTSATSIPQYLKDAVEFHGEKLYNKFHPKLTTNDLPLPLLLWSSVLEEYFTFKQDSNGKISEIEFASGVVYKGETIDQFLNLPEDGKRDFYLISKEFQ